jgi:hypothetical protein
MEGMSVVGSQTAPAASADLDALVGTATRIRAAVESVISGKPDVVRLSLVVILAEGHPGPAAQRRHGGVGVQPEHP